MTLAERIELVVHQLASKRLTPGEACAAFVPLATEVRRLQDSDQKTAEALELAVIKLHHVRERLAVLEAQHVARLWAQPGSNRPLVPGESRVTYEHVSGPECKERS